VNTNIIIAGIVIFDILSEYGTAVIVLVSGFPIVKIMANMITLHISFFRQTTILSLLMVSNSPRVLFCRWVVQDMTWSC